MQDDQQNPMNPNPVVPGAGMPVPPLTPPAQPSVPPQPSEPQMPGGMPPPVTPPMTPPVGNPNPMSQTGGEAPVMPGTPGNNTGQPTGQ